MISAIADAKNFAATRSELTMTNVGRDGGIKRDYHHPFDPYDIQLELMNKIYDTLDKNYKVGLFESPTGTGKTLSLICSTMTWLRQYKKSHIGNPPKPEDTKEVNSDSESEDEPEWVKSAYMNTIIPKYKQKLKDYEAHLDEAAHEYENNLNRVMSLPETKRQKFKNLGLDEFVPDDYHSESESTDRNEQLKHEVNSLLTKVSGNGNNDQFESFDPENSLKVIFSSRTHSQLNQFSGQLSMTNFESSLDDVMERTKYVPLGSRKQLCIHPKISKLPNPESINDACKDMNKQEKELKCEYLLNSRDKSMVTQFNDYSLTRIHDIEDLNSLGKNLKVCPYYSVRNSIKLTEIISLPYQMLLEDSTRDTLKLQIKDSIVIIDEAHNLLDVINSMNSVSISLDELNMLEKSLKFYYGKFIKRLNPGNRVNLMKLIKICQILVNYINISVSRRKVKSGQTIELENIFLGNTGDLFNIHKLNNYLSRSKISFKIENYLKTQNEHLNTTNMFTKSSTPLLFKLTKFLKCLSNPSKEGKFFWNFNNKENPAISYMLLDPSEIFRPIVEQCKCLILCGGTMEPMSDYTNYLFPYLELSQINKFACDHIIPDSNLKTIPITHYKGSPLEFLFKNRNDSNLIFNLGRCLIKLLEIIPKGVIVFFPSYKYLNDIISNWKCCNIYNDIMQIKKSVFIEPNDSGETDKVLMNYLNSIQENSGGVLFSVVGGKLSEGINFQDDLARAVIMIGLPYPNLMSGELIARKDFIESTTLARTGSKQQATESCRQYIENICMRSINQSIGRSIRHSNDYSMIYLIDERYKRANIQNKLSSWIKSRIINGLSFNDIIDQTNDFFMTKAIQKVL